VAGRGNSHSFAIRITNVVMLAKDFVKKVSLLLSQSKGFLMHGEVERQSEVRF